MKHENFKFTALNLGVCSLGCVSGRCISPGICTCYEGWTGPRCDRGSVNMLLAKT